MGCGGCRQHCCVSEYCHSLTHKHDLSNTHTHRYTHTHTQMQTHTASHLMMKSNSDPASMRTPSSVEIAPSTTGANMCSRATAERLFLLPIAVRKPCGGGGGGGEEKWVGNLADHTKLVLAARLGTPQNSCIWFCWGSLGYTSFLVNL